MSRRAPWTTLGVGAALLAANAVYSSLLARPRPARTLLRCARFESALVTAIPVLVVVLHGDPANALRYGVLVGVVGAAAVLPRTGEVAVVAMWAVTALIVADATAVRFDPAAIDAVMVARWAIESGIITTVAILTMHLHATRDSIARRLRAAAQQLERAKVDWEATFEGVHEMVCVTDDDGHVVRANVAFAKALGARPHELAGQPLADVMAGHPDRWWSSSGHGIVEIEDPLFDTLFEVTAVRHGARVVRVARDIGEQRRLYARLVQADKLAAVGAIASGVAHEINNPTAFVSSNLTELRRYLAAYESALADLAELGMAAGHAERVRALLARTDVAFARREAVSAVDESLQGMERIRRIVTNLRAIAQRDQAGEAAGAVDLADLVQAVVRTAASDLRSASARVDVRGPVWVLGHRGELVDVVLNLVVNAVQARDAGHPNGVAIELFRDGAHAVLRVSDTGRGISPSHMKRIFEPFFTSSTTGEGTGLGLSFARKIVLAHRGSIDVTSEIGEGTTFTVRLPAIDPGEAAPEALAREA